MQVLTFVKYDIHTDANKEVSLQFKVVGRVIRWKIYWYSDLTVESYTILKLVHNIISDKWVECKAFYVIIVDSAYRII